MTVWSNRHAEALVELYEQNDVPSDSLIGDGSALTSFTAALNRRLGDATFTEEDVAAKLLALRKAAKLPRLRK